MVKLSNIGMVQLALNCVIIIIGLILAVYVGGNLQSVDARLSLQFLGIGLAVIAMGASLIVSQFNALNMAEIKQILKEMQKK